MTTIYGDENNDDDTSTPNNAGRYDYRCSNCKSYGVERRFREESFVEYCPICEGEGEDRLQLFKRYFATAPAMTRVWHGHLDMSTGKWTTDYKQWKEDMHAASQERSERLNLQHNFIEVDASDRKSLKVTEEGLDTTHDAHVKMGLKESRGKFVWGK